MTSVNATTGGKITPFMWKKFPVEEDKFSVCIVSSSPFPKTEVMNDGERVFSQLVEYIKIIFPEKIRSLDETSVGTSETDKYTIYQECNNDWVEKISLFTKYIGKKHHIITVGMYDSIPETTLTNSKIIIFQTEEDANKYLRTHHGIAVSSFEIKDNFILIDKCSMGTINIHGLLKSSLIRYDKELRLSP